MLERLKKEVCRANLKLAEQGVGFQLGTNISAVDRASGWVVAKPASAPFQEISPDKLAVIALETGAVIEGKLRQGGEITTHLVLYRSFSGIEAIVQTHSLFATAWAQAHRSIPPLGTMHARYFKCSIPCTKPLKEREIQNDYERHTGMAIVERLGDLDPLFCPGVLVADHGPFAWGTSLGEAIHHAIVLERIAHLASETLRLDPEVKPIQRALLAKHFSVSSEGSDGQKMLPQSPSIVPRHD